MRCSGAAPIGVYLYPPPKNPPGEGFTVRAVTILSSPLCPGTWEQNSHQRFGRCLESHVTEIAGHSAKKNPRGQFRHTEDILIAVIPQAILYPH